MTEPWTSKPSVLLSKDNFKYFVPTDDMTYVEKINAITRFIIYASILLFLVRGNSLILLIPFISMLIIYFLVKLGFNIEELKEAFGEKKTDVCQAPTLNNPFMNVLPTDERTREPACKYTEKTKSKIENAFSANLYEDTTDIYGRNNSQRQFYTMPSTQLPNEQSEFASWLYDKGPTLKENPCW